MFGFLISGIYCLQHNHIVIDMGYISICMLRECSRGHQLHALSFSMDVTPLLGSIGHYDLCSGRWLLPIDREATNRDQLWLSRCYKIVLVLLLMLCFKNVLKMKNQYAKLLNHMKFCIWPFNYHWAVTACRQYTLSFFTGNLTFYQAIMTQLSLQFGQVRFIFSHFSSSDYFQAISYKQKTKQKNNINYNNYYSLTLAFFKPWLNLGYKQIILFTTK